MRLKYRTDLPLQGIWPEGARLWFEYHCEESHTSSDAQLWYRSHQQCVVEGVDFGCHKPEYFCKTRRGREGPKDQIAYRVRFEDGFVGCVLEDELRAAKRFYRPDPPKDPAKGE